ncbi:ABC transporter substrate-binding protein [Notoacmeibacter marinus]|uniref:ABC transporter substrate-binding protein n=1 Tax=Notoacmeibacter marinus TaxID=1876515 RepID=UPI001FE1BA9F|nr:ABC transporter substrate-binding protein [Notoacmeibacter marinus]
MQRTGRALLAAMTGLMALLVLGHGASRAEGEMSILVGYLERHVPPPPVLSNLEETPDDLGLAGARLAIKDNATTGGFLNQSWTLSPSIVSPQNDFLQAARDLLDRTPYLVVKAPREDLLALADMPEARAAILVNASLPDNDLRGEACRPNLLHTIPSRAMLADALAQFATKKRWTDWVLIGSKSEADMALADSFERAAAKFRLKLRERLSWSFEADMRRNAAAEVPLFLQDAPDHDMLVIADEAHDYGRYVLYNTWLPRPIGGSEGVVPSAWSASVEQHGAAQLQSRFADLTGRDMRSVDYAAWAAIRAVGEAVTRSQSAEGETVRAYMLSDEFELAGFKGRPLTFRRWNGQLRQPIPLTHPRALVAMAPLEGFLHRRNELDTLGLDQAESGCDAFEKER